MSELNEESMDDLFREHLGDDAPIPYDDQYWVQAQAMLSEQPRRRRFGFWYWTGLLVFVGLLGSTVYWIRQQKLPAMAVSQTATEKVTIQPSAPPAGRSVNDQKSIAATPSGMDAVQKPGPANGSANSPEVAVPEASIPTETSASQSSAAGENRSPVAAAPRTQKQEPLLLAGVQTERKSEKIRKSRTSEKPVLLAYTNGSGTADRTAKEVRTGTQTPKGEEKTGLVAVQAQPPVSETGESNSTSINENAVPVSEMKSQEEKPVAALTPVLPRDSTRTLAKADSVPAATKERQQRKDSIRNRSGFALQLGALAASSYGRRLNENQGIGFFAGLEYRKALGRVDFLSFGLQAFSRPGDTRTRQVTDSIFNLRLELKETRLRATMALYSGLSLQYGRWLAPRHLVQVGAGCTYLVQTYNRIETQYQGQKERKDAQTGYRSGLQLWDAQLMLGYEYKWSELTSLGFRAQLGLLDQTRDTQRMEVTPLLLVNQPQEEVNASRKDRNQFLMLYLRTNLFSR